MNMRTACDPSKSLWAFRLALRNALCATSRNIMNEPTSSKATSQSHLIMVPPRRFFYRRSIFFVRGACVYCMLLLAPSCYRLASAWLTSTCAPTTFLSFCRARRHYNTQTNGLVSSLDSKSPTSSDVKKKQIIVGTNVGSLTTRIRNAYTLRETDGILELATTTLSLDEYSPQQVIQSSLDAFSNSKGCTAGIINAWIGSCFERKLGAQFALQLLDAYDQVSDEFQIYPDIVTYSLVYSILVREEEYQEMAQKVLERAQRVSKKKAGSKRRRELAAARRRPQVSCATNVQDELQELYGCDFQVLQETSDFLVLSKPSGMACTHKHKTTAGKAKKRKSSDKDISLVNALLDKNVPLSTLNAEGRGLVHRIDRGTSGCIVLAKTDEMHAKLVTQFFLRRAKKTYTAVVTSQPAALVEAEIDMPVDGRPAKSKYRVTKQYDSGLTTIQVETMTGRKHQVRVHCAKGLNAPILYDPIYSDGKESAEQSGRFLLHASSLVIPDFDIDAQAPVPSWWEEEISNVQ